MHSAARVSGRLAFVERWQGRFEEALERMEGAYEVLAADEPDEDLAELAGRLAGAYVFAGETERAAERAELAITIAKSLGSAQVLGTAFLIRAHVAQRRGRPHESVAFLKQALEIALEHDLEHIGSIYFNLSDFEFHRDRYEDALGYLREGLELSRRRGSRPGEWGTLAEMTYPLFMLGSWNEALETAAQIPEERLQDTVTLSLLSSVTEICINRGDPEEARRMLSLCPAESSDVQE